MRLHFPSQIMIYAPFSIQASSKTAYFAETQVALPIIYHIVSALLLSFFSFLLGRKRSGDVTVKVNDERQSLSKTEIKSNLGHHLIVSSMAESPMN